MKKINFIDSIRQPIITEKATILSEQNKTVFKVHAGADKRSIKKNIEKLFKVTVVKVNIINTKTKKKLNKEKYQLNQDIKKQLLLLKKVKALICQLEFNYGIKNI